MVERVTGPKFGAVDRIRGSSLCRFRGTTAKRCGDMALASPRPVPSAWPQMERPMIKS
jgi:hypothetical protein